MNIHHSTQTSHNQKTFTKPRHSRSLTLATLAALLTLAACQRAPSSPAASFTITTAPLQLSSVTDVTYALAVYNGAGDLVWERPLLHATQFGTPDGAMSYVGPCDASDPQNRVELSILNLYEGSNQPIPATEWVNPTASGPLVQTITCRENADTPVNFNITVIRKASQGFFDIGVKFSNTFCSAKIDCQDAFLHDEDVRRPTVILGFACTSGAGNPTYLHLSDLALECDGVTTWLDPSQGPGQLGPVPPSVYQLATYRGQEALPGYDKCYWNTAIGLDLGPNAQNCALKAYATASQLPFAADGATPTGVVLPYFAFDLPLTNAAGAYVCSAHPLNGTPAGVATAYTSLAGTRFPHQWQCGSGDTISDDRVLCEQVQANGKTLAMTQTPGGVSISVDGHRSPLIPLPPGLRLEGCCDNACPTCQ